MRSVAALFVVVLSFTPRLSLADACGSYGKTPDPNARIQSDWTRLPYFENSQWTIVDEGIPGDGLARTLNAALAFQQWERDADATLASFDHLDVRNLDVRNACADNAGDRSGQIEVRIPFAGDLRWVQAKAKTFGGIDISGLNITPANGTIRFQGLVKLTIDGANRALRSVEIVQFQHSQEIERVLSPSFVDDDFPAAVVVPLLSSQLATERAQLQTWIDASEADQAVKDATSSFAPATRP